MQLHHLGETGVKKPYIPHSLMQITAFTEIGVMQRLAHMPGICKLHDYGINRQGIYLVMTRYTCSLRTWRAKQTVKPSIRLRLYMEIFCQLADLLKVARFFFAGGGGVVTGGEICSFLASSLQGR